MADENSESEPFLNPSRRSYVYETSRSSGNKKRVIFIIAGVIILIGLVAVAVVATGGKGEAEKNLTPSPQVDTPSPFPSDTPTPTTDETPTPTKKTTPTPTKAAPSPTGTTSTTDKTSGLDRANLKVAVLNGSGIAGAATKMSDKLKALGYDVVSSGNAENYDYESTEIAVKSTKKSYLDVLKKDLSVDYTIGSATSDYTGDSDAVVIVGKE